MEWILGLVTVLFVLGLFIVSLKINYGEQITPSQQREAKYRKQSEIYGDNNPVMICPHCQTKGVVRTRQVLTKQGISGGSVMAAILTRGLSLLFTGLSHEEQKTQAHCDNCKADWKF